MTFENKKDILIQDKKVLHTESSGPNRNKIENDRRMSFQTNISIMSSSK